MRNNQKFYKGAFDHKKGKKHDNERYSISCFVI